MSFWVELIWVLVGFDFGPCDISQTYKSDLSSREKASYPISEALAILSGS